jgi:dCTP deaminase
VILSDIQIRQALECGRIAIDPAPADDQFAPSAVDLHVGEEFKKWKQPAAGSASPIRLSAVCLPSFGHLMEDIPPESDGSIILTPGAFALAQTRERVVLPEDSRLAARVEGRSSYARLGLVVHMTAPTIHAGFAGTIVLEMMNFGPFPLKIDPGRTRICQLVFEELGAPPSCALRTVFQNQACVLGMGKPIAD